MERVNIYNRLFKISDASTSGKVKDSLCVGDDWELLHPPVGHGKATFCHFTSDLMISGQDGLVRATLHWEAKVSRDGISHGRPELADDVLVKEGLSELLIVVVCDHFLKEHHAVVLKNLVDLRVFVELFLRFLS